MGFWKNGDSVGIGFKILKIHLKLEQLGYKTKNPCITFKTKYGDMVSP